MRVTRAAQRAQQDVEEHVEDSEANGRALKDIEPNTSPVTQLEEPLPVKTPAKPPAKKGKGKAGKKGAKSKKAKTGENELMQDDEEAEVQVSMTAENDSAQQEPIQGHADDDAGIPIIERELKVPQTPAPRLTRRQLAKLEEEEALSKSQSLPPTKDITEDVAKSSAGQVEAAPEEGFDIVPDNANMVTRETSTTMKPDSAPKPTKRTQRQQTKIEEENPSEHGAEDAAANATEKTGSPDGIVHEKLTERQGTATTNEVPTRAEAETLSKAKRLTRRQQAKVEEKEQQSQSQQQLPGIEPSIVHNRETAEELQVEAIVAQEETSEENTDNIASGTEEAATSTPAVKDHSNADGLGMAPRQVIERGTQPEPSQKDQVVEYLGFETAKTDEPLHETVEARPATPTDAEFDEDYGAQVDCEVADEIIPSVEIISEAEPKMLCDEKPFDTVSTPKKQQDSTRRTSRSPTKSPMRIEESISAIDRLEEDLESIGTAIPDLGRSDDEKTPRKYTKSAAPSTTRGETSKTPAKTAAHASARIPAKIVSKTSSKTPAKAPVTVRSSIATKAPAAAKASLPTRISRVPNALPKSVKPTTTSLARASSVRTAPSKDVKKPLTETADYLASKRRPISLSFPTPPPPPKGRAPTKPTFQLSSENVAAKLKAQKEERLKREGEGTTAPKQRPISMPPLAKSTKPPTVPSFQLPGEATAARLKAQKEERLKRMEEAGGAEKPATRPISMPPPPKSTKPTTKPNFQLPGEATAARLKAQKEERLKRMEEAEAAKKAALAAPIRKPIAHRPRESLLIKNAPGVSIPPPPQNDALQRSTSLASKRSSIVGPSASRSTSTSSANRNSVLLAEGGKSTVTPMDAAALKSKGKQVFNRDKLEKEAMERERREKEEAAKKARAEAAERGRIASREWAERQRKKLMGQ